MAENFRDLFRWLLPSWLTEGEGGLVAYSLATLKDIYLERVSQGLVARFPSYSAGDALAEIGRERGLKQGYGETTTHYVERLQAWRVPKTHRVRGTAFAALREVQLAAGAGTFVRSIDTHGNEHTIDGAGVEAYAYGVPWAWDPPAGPRGRFWIELRDLAGVAANTYDPTSSDPLWTDPDGNETIGLVGITPRRLSDIRDLFNLAPQWKPAGSSAQWAVINITGGTVTPSGWTYWSAPLGVPSTQTPLRDPAFRYVELTRRAYVEREFFVARAPLLDGTLYAGDGEAPFLFNPVTLPRSKRLYEGDPSNFPPLNSIRLPDDGDAPR